MRLPNVSKRAVRLAGVLATAASLASAQDLPVADSLAPMRTLGLPSPLRLYGGLGAGLEFAGERSRTLSRFMVGGSRDLMNPVPGLAAIATEAWLGTRAQGLDGGARLMFANHAAGIQVGADYSLRLGRPDLALTVQHPLRRGGLLVPGAGVRLDWIPARSSLTASLTIPIRQRSPGRTRPRVVAVRPAAPSRTRTPVPEVAHPALRRVLVALRESARLTVRLVTPHLPAGDPAGSGSSAGGIQERLSRVRESDAATSDALTEIRRYHGLLDRAFALALEPEARPGVVSSQAVAVADAARRVLLEQVLLPYDRDLGRIRRTRVIRALRTQAADTFARSVAADVALSPAARARVLAVQHYLLRLMEEVARGEQRLWGDSRYVWLPLQYALRPEAHDTQSEIDGLLERITGVPFEGGNDVVYTTDERFEQALRRSILDTRDYHVLWIHDFAGRNPDKAPDLVALRVVQSYLTALTSAASAFDRTRRIPRFMIFLDQYYYRRSHSDHWLRVLEDPLGHRVKLSARHRGIQLAVTEMQQALRRAIEASPAIREEARRRGPDWPRRAFAVHVSVTHPPDPSFRGPRATGTGVSAMPDDIMRDHRKMAFADLSERDPSRGVAIITGLGVGEHYSRFQWLDRTLVLRGPAAIALKSEARALLRSQGFREREIPAVLRPDSLSPDRASQVAALERSGWAARVAIAMNAPGYGIKRATAAKAALYSLLPAGCTIVAADPQWLSRFWGGMLVGSALRGCRVLVIAPGPENAPFSTSFVQATLQRDLFLRLLHARDTLRPALQRSGGLLAIGLFRTGYGTDNVPAGVREVRDGLRRHDFLRRVFPFDQGVWDLFEQADSLLAAFGESAPRDDATWYHPRFHLKTQFFGSEEGMQEALGRPEWREFFLRRIRERLRESPAGTDIRLDHLSVLRDYLAGRSPASRDRQLLYLEVGSHNQDPRSFMLDGEELCLVAGESALIAAGDMLLLSTAGVEWIDDRPELDRYYPARGDLLTDAARAAEPLF
jgi:hypothetical protein